MASFLCVCVSLLIRSPVIGFRSTLLLHDPISKPWTSKSPMSKSLFEVLSEYESGVVGTVEPMTEGTRVGLGTRPPPSPALEGGKAGPSHTLDVRAEREGPRDPSQGTDQCGLGSGGEEAEGKCRGCRGNQGKVRQVWEAATQGGYSGHRKGEQSGSHLPGPRASIPRAQAICPG